MEDDPRHSQSGDPYNRSQNGSVTSSQQHRATFSTYPPPPPPPLVNNSSAYRGEAGTTSPRNGADISEVEKDQGHNRHEAEEGGSSGSKKRAVPSEPTSSDRGRPKARTTSMSSNATANTSVRKEPQNAGGAGGGGASSSEPGARRAAQACLRCRKQKLKCIGGWPCNRCTKSKNVCDFGRPGLGPPSREGTVVTEANARLEQLESSVANLLAGLAGSGGGGNGGSGGGATYPNGEMLHTFDPTRRRAESFATSESGRAYPPQKSAQWAPPDIPPPTHVRPLDPPRVGASALPLNAQTTSMSPDEISQHGGPHVRFTSSPNNTFIPNINSPSAFSSNGTGPSPASVGFGRSDSVGLSAERLREPFGSGKRSKGKGQKAEERLATATEADFDEAPFKALVYQPAVWDNREQSRRSSPQLSTPQSRDEPGPGTYEKRVMRDKDDPVNTDLVDIHMAHTLFDFFIDHCHPFLPVVNVALDDAFNTIRQSPFLISAIVAVAARFYIRFTSRSPGAYPPLEPSIPPRLANLAEAHLGNTLLRKQHALSDVQAVMLLAAWGLQSGGRGPDAWVVTGHAARIARRLGVHKVLSQAAGMARITRPGTEGWDKLDAFMPQWRTWLCWFCFDGFLSLGFGRPQSTQFETVDEQGFLQIRMNQTLPRPGSTPSISLYGDVYIAGQVQLTQIGRDLINWGEMLADPTSALWADPRRADMFHDKELNVRNMFKDLNARLDEWSRLWLWSGSPYTLYLGSSARIARLQADHMRLCLNSFALKSGPDEDPFVAQCLKKALNAAMSTIQTHFESSQTDMALSFATDYLTITLAQAAVFLVRMTKASPIAQNASNIDPPVIAHYLKMSIDLLEAGELSETRLSTYLAKTIRDIARAADIGGIGQPDGEEDLGPSRPQSAHASLPPTFDSTQPTSSVLGAFDMESFLQFESQLDLGYLLGLPGDNSAIVGGSMTSLAGPDNTAGGGGMMNAAMNLNQGGMMGGNGGGVPSLFATATGQGGIYSSGGGMGPSAEFTYGMGGMGYGVGPNGTWGFPTLGGQGENPGGGGGGGNTTSQDDAGGNI
ncbi:hypothetical protein IAR55_000097 [Kwoniella newhampshirensis]|uniref:Zn(2)-C6 fungal-type domain-containing protein n=1 Tax=Kwoniella newhampshirensis TaxID=1651941 RepID=A0AAW0Z5X3_9TREE